MKPASRRTTKFIRSIAALALAGASTAHADPAVRDLWNATQPLPAALFSQSAPCQSTSTHTQNVSDNTASGHFLTWTRFGVRDLLRGLCFEAAGLAFPAWLAYQESRKEFIYALNQLAAAKAEEQREAESRRETVEAISGGLSLLLGTVTPKNAAHAQQIQSARAMLQMGTEVQLGEIQRNLQALAREQPARLTESMRIPVFPVAGFLKHLVRVQRGAGHCTGSFVGPRIVLTNFHCVGPDMRVIRDHIVAQETFSVRTWWTYRGERAVPAAREAFNSYAENDWALLELNEFRADADDYLFVPEKTPSLAKLMVAGYSGDVSGGSYLTLDVNCPLLTLATLVRYHCSTYKGSSGTPVFSMYDQRVIVALNAGLVLDQTDTANTRGTKLAVRVEKFAPTLYRLLGQPAPAWLATGSDSRAGLVHAKALYDRRSAPPKLPSWDD